MSLFGHGATGRTSGMGPAPDLDTTGVRRRVYEPAIVFEEDVTADDWEEDSFSSSRVASGRYSPSRRELIVEWTNGRQPYRYTAVPPAVWTGFRGSGSQGQFVNHTLNTFPYGPYNEGY